MQRCHSEGAFFVNFIREGSESLVKLLNELDKEILVIDDNPDIRFLICNILKENNYEIDHPHDLYLRDSPKKGEGYIFNLISPFIRAVLPVFSSSMDIISGFHTFKFINIGAKKIKLKKSNKIMIII